ncbi:MAG TPA: phosphoribosylanthranilate isomerase [Rhizobiales bacterium]|nr:phosphoribosylanthranilate isomerase [Hyphomicrobiales bacterium]
MSVKVKTCGMNSRTSVQAAIEAGADYLGFVFYEPSPRHVSYCEAGELALGIPPHIARVALIVDADDARIDQIIRVLDPDILQAHGHESPGRIEEISRKFDRPVWKAIAVRTAADVAGAQAYEGAARRILFDARPPENLPRALPGGNALSFDWKLLAQSPITDFVLAGGLTPQNVGEAVRQTGAPIVDASSSLESKPGMKDNARIEAFIRAVKSL